MKLPPIKNRNWNYLALAFAVPCVGMLLVMLVSQYEPFGKYSMLYSDMYHQYYPFFKAFRQALLSGDSLLYSWNVGMGMDYLGLISYYLASPLNLLSVLVPEGFLLEFFSLLVPIKLGLAGLFFAIFLKKTFKKDDLSITLFGALYALCAWALGYQWNVMWLDTFALLPLVALGTIRLLRDRNVILYTLTLFLSVYSNYYVGFFTCIFVLLLFICYQICRCRSVGRFFLDLFRIALFSALAIGMTAILELPALAALQTTQSSVNTFPEGFKLNIVDENTWKGLLDAMRQVAGNMGGGLTPSFKEGLPNLYCGVGTIVLGFLFLSAKKVRLRDKICCVVLLLFFVLSFIIRQLDYIWHGFHFPNMIPYRFSFLFSFILLYMAYRAYLMRRRFRLWQIITAAVLALAILMCSDSRTDPAFLAYNLVFLLLYLAVFLYGRADITLPKMPEERASFSAERKRRRRFADQALAGVMALEIILNLVNFGINFPGTAVSNYPKGTDDAAAMIRYMKEREEYTLFYRAETNHSQTLNDGALNGYNGVSTFTSSANVRVTEFMKSLGYAAQNTYNRYLFEESSPVANLFLNLKYMIERDGKDKESTYFHDIIHFGNVHLLENTAYLPLGFLAEPDLANVNFSTSGNHFSFQNTLFTAATGIGSKVWQSISGSNLSVSAEGFNVKSQTSTGYCSYDAPEDGGTLIYSYTANRDGFLCIDVDLSKNNNFTVWKNNVELYQESDGLPQMYAVSDVETGDVIDIKVTCKADESGFTNIRASILDAEVFRRGYDILNASTLELTTFENTLVEGTITCDRDGLLYTSIPQNGNWFAAVDGQEAEAVLVGGAMVAIPLTEGTHTVTFTYRNAAFSWGWKITLACAAVFIILAVTVYKPKKALGKYEKQA